MEIDLQVIDKYIKDSREYLLTNETLYEIYNGRLKEHLEDVIYKETESENARKTILSRMSPINILQKVVQKLSKVYLNDVRRKNKFDLDEVQEEIDAFEYNANLQSKLQKANEMYNLHGCVAIELLSDKTLRILPAHTFLPFSASSEDDSRMTHFIKLIDKNNYIIYDENSFVEVQGTNIIEEGVHNLGMIPFIYLNKNEFMLKPFEDKDTLQMTYLLPLMLTDLNYALRFQSHSIVYGINVDAEKLQATPDSFWSFSGSGVEGDKPEIGTIKPNVDSEKMLSTIQSQFSLWLDTKNIKTYSLSSNSSGYNLSGISKAIDNADVSDEIELQLEVFKQAEYKLFELYKRMNNNNIFIDSKQLNDNFEPLIIFMRKSAIIETNKEKLENIILKLDKNLTSRKRALNELYPDYTENEIELLLQEIDEDISEDVLKESTDASSDTNNSSFAV